MRLRNDQERMIDNAVVYDFLETRRLQTNNHNDGDSISNYQLRAQCSGYSRRRSMEPGPLGFKNKMLIRMACALSELQPQGNLRPPTRTTRTLTTSHWLNRQYLPEVNKEDVLVGLISSYVGRTGCRNTSLQSMLGVEHTVNPGHRANECWLWRSMQGHARRKLLN